MQKEKIHQLFTDANIVYKWNTFRTKFRKYEIVKSGADNYHVRITWKKRKNDDGSINWPVTIMFYADLKYYIHRESVERSTRLKEMKKELGL